MRKIATILVALLILSSVAPYDVLAGSLETNNEISIEGNQANEQEAIEEQGVKDNLDETENNTEFENDEENNENAEPLEIIDEQEYQELSEEDQEINEEELITQESNDGSLKEENAVEQEISTEENKEDITTQYESEEVGANEIANRKITMNMFAVPTASPTSRLGHIRNGSVKIYSGLESNASFVTAGSKYTNAVYYIKQQNTVNDNLYYLISTNASSTKGVVGWVKASDLSTHTHVGIDKKSKTFSIKGTGNAYDTAWGGSKNLVYDLSKYKDHIFNVHLTEKVGNNTWYRGTLDGKTVWIDSSYLVSNVGSSTSRLGHIRSGSVKIYSSLESNASFEVAGSKYTNAVYYIKSQSQVNGKVYYLISTSPSNSRGLVGWVQASDLSTHSHVGVDKASKTFYIKGTGKSYNKAWGGSKNLVYDLSKDKDHIFNVHLTEKVGNNTWYRGTLNGKTVWIHSSYLVSSVGSSTSRLGHIRNGNVKIYLSLESNASFEVAGSKYTNAVYYIKSQSQVNGKMYYLISTSPSNSKGLVGWVEASDLSTYSHVGVDKKVKTFYFKGTGKAYRKAWGGSKDMVHSNMLQYANQEFKVNLTEKVGNNTWYRGVFEGETIWLHSSYVTTKTESTISRLGHIRSGSVKIYPTLGQHSSAFTAGSQYTNAVYYIKKQAKINDQIYYLISTSPSSTNGIVGWVNSKDLSTHSHVGVDKKAKTLYFKGTGIAYSKAWGGSKDIVYENMVNYKGQEFKVDLTEKVGNNTWYRGTFNGKRIWLHSSYVNVAKESEYNLTLNQALEIQMKAAPQTDKKYAWVSKDYIDKNNKVTATNLNVRPEPNTSKDPLGTLSKGDSVKILEEYNGWYAIEYSSNHQWRHARPADVMYYLNPLNFINDSIQRFQFIDLARTSGASKTVLNNYLKGKGILDGQAEAFIEAGRQHGLNEIYLISHAILETGNGTSTLANGVKYNGVTVYNMYGIGAYDSCPVDCGAEHAYEEGWTTPAKAIIGGAKFIGNDYVKAGQNTLYKMRWNPAAMESTGRFGKQYATDVGWASKQITTMYNLYQQIGFDTLHLDIPVYK